MIFIHSAYLSGVQSSAHRATAAIGHLAVPYFLALFCFFLERGLLAHRPDSYSGRLTRLIIPFIVWSAIYFGVSKNFPSMLGHPLKLITTYGSGYGWAGQYFFVLLFQLIVLFPWLRLMASNRLGQTLILAFTLLTYIAFAYYPGHWPVIVEKIGIRPIIYWLPYALLDITLARGKSRMPRSPWLLLVLLLVPLDALSIDTANPGLSAYLRPSVLVVTLVTLPVLMSLGTSLSGGAGRLLARFGSHSMALFVLNPIIIIVFDHWRLVPAFGPLSG